MAGGRATKAAGRDQVAMEEGARAVGTADPRHDWYQAHVGSVLLVVLNTRWDSMTSNSAKHTLGPFSQRCGTVGLGTVLIVFVRVRTCVRRSTYAVCTESGLQFCVCTESRAFLTVAHDLVVEEVSRSVVMHHDPW